MFAGIGSDIADPDASRDAPTRETPLRAAAVAARRRCDDAPARPRPDHLPGADREQPAGPRRARRRTATTSPTRSTGPVERVTLERSYHVATHDYDKDDRRGHGRFVQVIAA